MNIIYFLYFNLFEFELWIYTKLFDFLKRQDKTECVSYTGAEGTVEVSSVLLCILLFAITDTRELFSS